MRWKKEEGESSANIRKVGERDSEREREILIVIIVVDAVAAVPELISEPFAFKSGGQKRNRVTLR